MNKAKNSTEIKTEFAGDSLMQATTAAMNQELKNAKDIKPFLKANKANMISQSLSSHLKKLLKQKGMRRADVARDSQLDRKYVYQIFSGEKTPSRDKLIAIAFGLHLSEDETQAMLKLSGNRELYVKDERDAIILYALQRNKSISMVNDIMYDYDLEVLGVPRE